MLQHGGTSSKPTIFWGNMSTMGDLNKGRLSKEERLAKTTVQTTSFLVANVFLALWYDVPRNSKLLDFNKCSSFPNHVQTWSQFTDPRAIWRQEGCSSISRKEKGIEEHPATYLEYSLDILDWGIPYCIRFIRYFLNPSQGIPVWSWHQPGEVVLGRAPAPCAGRFAGQQLTKPQVDG